MRDPSIHVKKSSLVKILEDIVQGDATKLADEIVHRSKGYAIRNRQVLNLKAWQKKKAQRVGAVDKDLADRFNAIYQGVIMKNNIRTSTITPTDSRYTTLKEVAKLAQDFSKMFEMDEERGFKAYVELGIQLAGNNFSIYRLKGLSDKIIKYYEDMEAIEGDKYPDDTLNYYIAWKEVVQEYTGSSLSIEEPHLYVHFIYGRVAADKEEANYRDWIAAQFEQWGGNMPELSQFYGDRAKMAYTKYMGAQKKEYNSEDEKDYFEKGKVKAKTPQRRKVKGKA